MVESVLEAVIMSQ